ncbi:MAG: hypothetical protein ABI871_00805 [Chthoniobacterales bacterium]
MMNSRSCAFSSAIFWSGISFALAADNIPKAAEFSRYEAMMNRSPFAVATAVAAPAAAPDFAKDLYVANAARSADGDLVTIASSSDKNLKEYLTNREPNKSGYSISNIEWSDKIGATKVTISKDGQFATLTFNQALVTQPLTNQSQMVQPVIAPALQPAGMAVPNPNVVRPAPIPMLPTPPPHIRGVIQRNPAALPQSQVPQPVPPTPDEE